MLKKKWVKPTHCEDKELVSDSCLKTFKTRKQHKKLEFNFVIDLIHITNWNNDLVANVVKLWRLPTAESVASHGGFMRDGESLAFTLPVCTEMH